MDRTAYKKAWYEQNREKCLQNKREYYLENKEKIKSYQKEWRENHSDKKKEMDRSWKDRHPVERRLQTHTRRARVKLNGVSRFKKEQISNCSSRLCGICSEYIENNFHIDHIIPISKGGSHTIENVQLTHPFCNLSKNDKI